MSQFICPLCGKFVSVGHYDPSEFEEDILLVQVRGLGHGKGVEIVERYSLLNGENPELLDLISDRIAIIYDLLYEDEGNNIINKELFEIDDEEEEDKLIDTEYKELYSLLKNPQGNNFRS